MNQQYPNLFASQCQPPLARVRRWMVCAAICGMGAGLQLPAALAQTQSATDYPNKPVKIVVGFPAGGGTDVFARVLAQGLSAQLGQQFVIDNKPGAGGVIASQSMLQLPADGYSLLVGSTSTQAIAPCFTISGLTGPRTSLPLRTLPA